MALDLNSQPSRNAENLTGQSHLLRFTSRHNNHCIKLYPTVTAELTAAYVLWTYASFLHDVPNMLPAFTSQILERTQYELKLVAFLSS